ncbi:MAG: hypothetical protein HY552_06240 [Elusimicrobia bacterium]|nr:hypothetical protein [Elusimicrobiota bacterium]
MLCGARIMLALEVEIKTAGEGMELSPSPLPLSMLSMPLDNQIGMPGALLADSPASLANRSIAPAAATAFAGALAPAALPLFYRRAAPGRSAPVIPEQAALSAAPAAHPAPLAAAALMRRHFAAVPVIELLGRMGAQACPKKNKESPV